MIINTREFSCDCLQTGYEGDLCEIGVVIPPDFPKVMSGYSSKNLILLAKPDNSLTIHFNSTMNLTFDPKELIIKHPTSKAEFRVIGHNSGVGMVSYDVEGVDRHDFAPPKNSSIFIGCNISNQKSIYTRLGLLDGELPIGCQTKNLDSYPCDITMVYNNYSTSTVSNDLFIETGPVHILTPDNKTIPLSLVGYDFSSPHPTDQEILEKLISRTKVTEKRHAAHRPVNQKCSPFQHTAEALIEFIQKDALPKSFLRYFAHQLPLWLKVTVGEDSNLFAIENTLANLVKTIDKQYIHPNCKFPLTDTHSAVVTYLPIVKYNVSVQNQQLSMSSKGCCFATDICGSGVFLTLAQRASKEMSTMPFMKDMADRGWKLLFSSFGFITPRRYSSIINRVPVGPMAAEYFSDFYYNLWWQGSADILLKHSSDFAMNMKMNGEGFAFVEDLNSVSTTASYSKLPYCYLFSRELNFAKMEEANFARLKFQDLTEKSC